MCLQTTWKEPKVAKRNITVYKSVVNEDNKFLSPYAFPKIEYKIGETYTSTMKIIEDSSNLDDEACEAFEKQSIKKKFFAIGPGLHSSLSKERIKNLAVDQIVLKCIIPKGAKYYNGLTKLVVSDKIKVIGLT
jgi:hypothetical protein